MNGLDNNSSAALGLHSSSNQSQEANKKVGFRIKKAANIAMITLAATFTTVAVTAAVTGTILAFTASHVIAPVLFGMVIVSCLVGLTILGLLKVWEKVTPHLPPVLRVPANYIQSTVCGVASAVALAALWPTNLTKKNIPAKDVDPSKPMTIVVHGFMGSSNNWMYHRGRLKEAGYTNFASVNLGNWLDPIDNYIEKLRALVLHYKNNAPLPPDGKLKIQFLCHSMGGLVAGYYNQKYAKIDGVEVEDIITLGTPLDGTRVAYLALGLSGAARQMHPKSQFTRNLQELVTKDTTTHHLHVGSKCDLVVPNKSAITAKAKNCKVVVAEATGHVSMLFSDFIADTYIDYLNNRKASKSLPV